MQETSKDKFVGLSPINFFIEQLSGIVKNSFSQNIILPPSQHPSCGCGTREGKSFFYILL